MNFLNEGGPYEQSELTRLSNIHLIAYYVPVIWPTQVLLESTTEMTGKMGGGGCWGDGIGNKLCSHFPFGGIMDRK